VSYFGVVKKVYDNKTKGGPNKKDPSKIDPPKPYWGVLLDTDDKGAVVMNLWDCTMAGHRSAKGEDPLCDVHDFIDKRVMFDAKVGAEKPDGSGCYPSSIILIQLAEEEMPTGASKPLDGLLADDARSAKVEAAVGITQHLEAAQRHLGAAIELAKAIT
jgi:hypothetical protein